MTLDIKQADELIESASKKPKRTILIIIVAIILLALGAWVFSFFSEKGKQHASEKSAYNNQSKTGKSILNSPPASEPISDINQGQEKIEVPSLEKLFKEDFPNLLRGSGERKIGVETKDGKKTILIGERIYLDFEGKSKFIGYFIPRGTDSYDICAFMADEYHTTIESLEKNLIIAGRVTEYSQTTNRELIFTGRVYIYHEDSFTHQQLADLEKLYKSKELSVIFRGPEYLAMSWKKNIKSNGN
jgi:hypothetical protein